MKMVGKFICYCCCLLAICGQFLYAATTPETKNIFVVQYVEAHKDLAVAEMQMWGVPASVTLAQAILETGAGSSRLAKEANNHFGIKCKSQWQGATIFADDNEPNECFRKYGSVAESYRDHSLFLKHHPRASYDFMFVEPMSHDYKVWAEALRMAGYSTSSDYATRLIRLVELYNLQQYDTFPVAANKIAPAPAPVTAEIVVPVAAAVSTQAAPTHQTVPSSASTVILINPSLSESIKNSEKKNTPPPAPQKPLKAEKKEDVRDSFVFSRAAQQKTVAEADTNLGKVHIVETKDTMEKIAKKYNISVARLYAYNYMTKGTQPKKGAKIYIDTYSPHR